LATSKQISEAREKYLKKVALRRSGAVEDINETKEQQQERIAKARKDVAFFASWYLGEFAESKSAGFQVDFAKKVGKNKKAHIIVRWGRGLAKSVWCDLIIPLWLWTNDDINYMVLVANNLDKAKILLSDIQAEFESNPRLRHDFGEQKTVGSWEDGYFKTKNGFTAKALGMGQSPRGLRSKNRRPDYIVCDDLEDRETVKNPKRQDEVVKWIEQDLLPTMDGETRRYLHPNNNPAPRTIQDVLWKRHENEWQLNQVNAYNANYKPAWSEKYNDEYYREIELEIGTIAAQSEYNNRPWVEGKVFTEKQIIQIKAQHYPKLSQFRVIVGHWDIAYSGNFDFNAVRVWGLKDDKFWYIDSLVQQCKMWRALEFMAEFQLSLPETVTIHWQYEAQFWNDAVKDTISDFERITGLKLYLVKVDTPRTKKYDRILRLQAYYQNKKIMYPEDKVLHDGDCIEGLQQLYGIEPGYNTHDDAPDADEQAIAFLERHIRRYAFEPRQGKIKLNSKRKG
jgi:phage terminase large subunit-like protein